MAGGSQTCSDIVSYKAHGPAMRFGDLACDREAESGPSGRPVTNGLE